MKSFFALVCVFGIVAGSAAHLQKHGDKREATSYTNPFHKGSCYSHSECRGCPWPDENRCNGYICKCWHDPVHIGRRKAHGHHNQGHHDNDHSENSNHHGDHQIGIVAGSAGHLQKHEDKREAATSYPNPFDKDACYHHSDCLPCPFHDESRCNAYICKCWHDPVSIGRREVHRHHNQGHHDDEHSGSRNREHHGDHLIGIVAGSDALLQKHEDKREETAYINPYDKDACHSHSDCRGCQWPEDNRCNSYVCWCWRHQFHIGRREVHGHHNQGHHDKEHSGNRSREHHGNHPAGIQ